VCEGGVQGLGFRVQGSGFRVKVEGLGFVAHLDLVRTANPRRGDVTFKAHRLLGLVRTSSWFAPPTPEGVTQISDDSDSHVADEHGMFPT